MAKRSKKDNECAVTEQRSPFSFHSRRTEPFPHKYPREKWCWRARNLACDEWWRSPLNAFNRSIQPRTYTPPTHSSLFVTVEKSENSTIYVPNLRVRNVNRECKIINHNALSDGIMFGRLTECMPIAKHIPLLPQVNVKRPISAMKWIRASCELCVCVRDGGAGCCIWT